MDIQWYPGHMAKAKRQLAEKLKLINVAVVVADARAPRSTMNPDLWKMLSDKPCVVVLNKRDLANEAMTAQWIAKYAKHGAALAFSATQDKPAILKAAIDKAAAPVVEKYAAKGMNKTVRVLVAGGAVEGRGAAAGIVEGMRCVVRGGAELVLVVRGGGSFEDLMPFNDEGLARAIVACPVPVVTGIGHEPDTSIADMVADVRASTPTAAAEAASPSREGLGGVFESRARALVPSV